MDRQWVTAYIRERFGGEPEYPWSDSPDAFVVRHASNRKWYVLVMSVERRRLGLAGDGAVDAMNVKCGPILSGSYLPMPGIFPAYHMNKIHWLTALLDGTVPEDVIRELLEISYDLTNVRPKESKKKT